MEEDKNRLRSSLSSPNTKPTVGDFQFTLDIKPYHYQKEILEKLKAERTLFGRNKNLIVAATGVGKTVIAAFDYKDFTKQRYLQGNIKGQ